MRWTNLRVSLRLLLESTAMDGRIDVTTLLFLVVAVVIFLKLRSVLGRRTGHEQGRYERYKAQQEAAQRNGKLAGPDKVVTLPRREREVMSLVTAGLMNKQIAGQLDLSEITVKIHRGHVMRKMGARSLADLVRMAEALGISAKQS